MWLISGILNPGISQHFPCQHSGELDPSPFSNPLEFVSPHILGIAFIWRFFPSGLLQYGVFLCFLINRGFHQFAVIMAAFYSRDGVGSNLSLVLTAEADVAWTRAGETRVAVSWAAASSSQARVCPETIPGSCSVIQGRNSLGKGEQRVKKPQKQGVRGRAMFNICFMDEKLRHRETK